MYTTQHQWGTEGIKHSSETSTDMALEVSGVLLILVLKVSLVPSATHVITASNPRVVCPCRLGCTTRPKMQVRTLRAGEVEGAAVVAVVEAEAEG